ncbi:MAG: nucleotidyl transferase AbiEii/AbiGii toxin family protein [Thermoleophilaceae bacterium]
MRYRDAAAFRQALEQRLKHLARGDDAQLVNARRRVLFYRLLARLATTGGDRWLLKGGLALDLRLPEQARATRDIDLDWEAPPNELLDALIEGARHDAGDFLDFAVERWPTSPEHIGGSHRFRVVVRLAGRPFDSFQVDVGFADRSDREPERLRTPDVLAFADVEPPIVAAMPVEVQVAEKLHAYTRAYDGDRPSTRVKDLVDLALIAEFLTLDAARLADALEVTFRNRATHPIPPSLTGPPGDWRVPFRELAGATGAPADLAAGHAQAAAFLDPILAGTVTRGRWDHRGSTWTAVGAGGE